MRLEKMLRRTAAEGSIDRVTPSNLLLKPALCAGFFVAAASLGATAAAQMMMLPGQFDVSPSGAALYSVPIEVPPGTGGMSPALTLDYDSDGGNGLLGSGWNLGGLPSIGRCPKNYATDSVRGRVDFSSTDRFCMDGQRLVVVSGTYGAAGSEYRTEIEGFTKIVAYGTAGNGPSYFKAWTKSGQIIEFGNSTDSRILAVGTSSARSWAANKITDTKGNYLTITYFNDTTNGEAYPTQIDYTGNAGAGVSPYNSVQFEYFLDTSTPPKPIRDDIRPVYVAGSLIKNTARLKKIKTFAGATPVRVYELVYSVGSSTQQSTITSIKLCDGGGTNCLPATNFSLTTASLTFPTLSTDPISTSEMGTSVALYIGDWNGDGVTDAMTWDPSNGANNWYVNNGSLSFTKTTNPIATAQITGASSELYVGDWDGDAITDIMWRDPATGDNRWFTNSSTGGAPAFAQTTNPIAVSKLLNGIIAIGDWNGDAISDIMWRSSISPPGYTNKWFVNDGALGFSSATYAPYIEFTDKITTFRTYEHYNAAYQEWVTKPQVADLYFQDWNADGRVDVLAHFPAKEEAVDECYWYLNDSTGFVLNSTATVVMTNVTSNLCTGNLSFGDWNADGSADVLVYTASTGANKWYLNNGAASFTLINNPITPSTIANSEYILNIGDWNSDGISDVMFHLPSSGSNRWFTTSWNSAGAIVFAYSSNPLATANVSGTGSAFAFGDWNGRAFDMPMFRLPSSGRNRWWRNDAAVPPDRISSVTTGLGSVTTVTMKPITDNSVYTKETTAAHPIIDIEVPFFVTSRVDADNGVGGAYASSYSYSGAKIHALGRGFLGFKQQVATDLQTNVVQTLTFRQDYPFIGFVLEDKKVRSGTVLNDRDNVYGATTTGSSPNIRTWPYLDSVTEASKDLNGATFPTVSTTYTYDGYGNPLTVSVSTPSDGAVRTTTNTYINDTANWLLGRLLTSTVSSTTPDVTPSPTGCQSNCNGTPPSFAIDDVTVAEGATATFTVTRSVSSTGAYQVGYSTANGTATAGADYTSTSGTLTFANGETSKTISVVTLNDAVSEGNETFTLTLSGATGGAGYGANPGTGTITNVPPPSFSVNDIGAEEGTNLVFTITRSGDTSGSNSVTYASANGTATSPSDYGAFGATVTFTAGQTTKTVSTFLPYGVNNEAAIEYFYINLSNPTGLATISDSQGVGSINNIPLCGGVPC